MEVPAEELVEVVEQVAVLVAVALLPIPNRRNNLDPSNKMSTNMKWKSMKW